MKKKNILLITSDQQHFNTIGKYNDKIKTPNLDKLIDDGKYFSKAYCPNPTCTPTRASLITGLYPSQHGAYTLGTKLDESIPTIGTYLKEEGYRTSLIGKAHFQPLTSTEEHPSVEAYPLLQDLEFWKTFNENRDNWYGFDYVELARNHTTESHVGQHYALWLEEKGCSNWKDYFLEPTGHMKEDKVVAWEIPEEFHYNNWIAERSNSILESYKENGETFMLWASFFDPHPSYVVPEPYFSMYDDMDLPLPNFEPKTFDKMPPHYKMCKEKGTDFSEYEETGFAVHGLVYHDDDKAIVKKNTAIYYGMVTMMDKYIGKIIDKLKTLDLYEETIIVFTTDHGNYIGEHGLMHKGPFMYEDLIKVPMIVSSNVMKEKGLLEDSIQSLVDIPSTLLSMVGMEVPKTMSGVDQSRVWLGEIR